MSRVTSFVAVAVSARIGTRRSAGLQAGQVAIRGTEVVTPLADAMRFVHRDERQAHLRRTLPTEASRPSGAA